MMAYRSTVHESTKCTPNLVMLGRETNLPIDVLAGTTPTNPPEIGCYHSYVEWIRNTMEITYGIVHENLRSSFKRQKRYHDVRLKPREFAINDLVWRWYPPKANQKLGSGWTGPYRVVRKFSDITYEIRHETTKKTVVVHVDRLKQLHGDGTSENQYDSDNDQDESCLCDQSSDSECDNMSDQEESEPLAYESPDLDAAPSRRADTFSRKGRLIKPVFRYSP